MKDLGESGLIDKNGVSYKSYQFARAIRNCMYNGSIKKFNPSRLKKNMAHQTKPFLLYGGTKQMVVEMQKIHKKVIA